MSSLKKGLLKAGITILAVSVGGAAGGCVQAQEASVSRQQSPAPLSPQEITNNIVNVTPETVGNYFSTQGSGNNNGNNDWRAEIDPSTGLVTLTQDHEWFVGSVTLNTKINLNQDFTLTGKVNLGDKTKDKGGADGIGFVFHPGDTNVVGKPGQWLGMGGLPNSFGFKLDTYYNDLPAYPAEDGSGGAFDPAVILDDSGTNVVTNGTTNKSFADFMSTNDKGQMTTSPTPNGTPATVIPDPKNNQLVHFAINYTAANHLLTVEYGDKSGTEDITSLMPKDGRVSFSITGSTGGNFNLQQVQIDSFSYTRAVGRVTVRYVDQNGNPISPNEVINGDILDPYETSPLPSVPGKYVLTGTPANAKGSYTADDQTVTYVYNASFLASAPHIVSEAVKYVDESGNELASPASQKITIVSVTNQATGDKVYYHKTGDQPAPSLDPYGKPDVSWETGDASLDAISNPAITNYHVVSTTDPAGDLTQTTAQKVEDTSKDLDFTVTYAHDKGSVTVHAVDIHGNVLQSLAATTGNVGDDYSTTAPTIPNYKLVQTPDNKNGVYIKDNQDVTYVYAIDYKVSKVHVISETIHYVDKNGKQLANDNSQNVSFVIVTNPVTGEKDVYYKSGDDTKKPEVDENGNLYTSWTKADQFTFGAVKNPVIEGFHVISTTDKDSDLTETAEKKVDENSEDVDVTVVYDKDGGEEVIPPVKPSEPTKPNEPAKPVTPNNPALPSKPGTSNLVVSVTQSSKAEKAKSQLPKTGERRTSIASLAGFGAICLGVFGLMFKKHKTRD